ncbi:hypothetical protein HanXRQr2_Chr15g0698431 [Helianthus annuus]|uniref:Uncharacterized protein n=1 Tax=Helianthus annuus TaxID=4232 RepID=A0A9K3E1H4_HELAN|nr:hypothetical protein HanXRQr2_Chr15g0698431 [Helianthus annuus]
MVNIKVFTYEFLFFTVCFGFLFWCFKNLSLLCWLTSSLISFFLCWVASSVTFSLWWFISIFTSFLCCFPIRFTIFNLFSTCILFFFTTNSMISTIFFAACYLFCLFYFFYNLWPH